MTEYTLNQRQAREASLIYLYQLLTAQKIAACNDEVFNFTTFINDLFPGLNYQLQEKFKTEKPFNIINNDLCKIVIEKSTDIDKILDYVNSYITGWRDIKNSGAMEQAILVLSFIQFKYTDIHHTPIINEAIELTKEYCGNQTYKFINGVLDKMSKNIVKTGVE